MKIQIINILTLFLLSCSTNKEEEVTKIPILIDQEAKNEGFNIFYVPIKIDGIEKEFKMQFDLGLDVSAIYGNSLDAIIEKYPDFKKSYMQKSDYQILKTKYRLSTINSVVDSLFVFPEYGSDKNFQEQEIIGSIGVNQFKNQVLLINYKELYIQIFDNENQLDKDKYDFTPMTITKNNKIIITLKVDNELVDFLFDTGNGVPIATINKDFFIKQTDNQKELRDTINGNSWGEKIYLFGAKQQKNIGTKNIAFPVGNNRIYYTEAKRIVELYKGLNIEHSIGNNFFMDKTIIFDFKNTQFAMMK